MINRGFVVNLEANSVKNNVMENILVTIKELK